MVMEIIVSVILLFVGIAVLVVIHVCIVGRAFRTGINNQQGVAVIPRSSIFNGGTKRMSREDLKGLPCFDYKEEESTLNGIICGLDCAVCLENFQVGDNCRLLPICKHSFHSKCIDSWLLKTPICPICRTCVNPPKVGKILEEETSFSGDSHLELT